ncbi:PASTA domain-containing protein [Streptomyces sp. NPDC002889]|uniref:PASTA domain-containing protein n=1 Tax=Streptomyces sp. NPDC002889 TaxID=3364669 RepID=UPI003698759C
MRTRYVAAVLLAGCLPLTACAGGTMSSDKPESVVTETVTSEPEDGTGEVTMPDFVGMGLQEAEDTAQIKGLFMLTAHDSSGAGRQQVFDRNWKVCTQEPAPGETVSTDTPIDVGAVETDETCP